MWNQYIYVLLPIVPLDMMITVNNIRSSSIISTLLYIIASRTFAYIYGWSSQSLKLKSVPEAEINYVNLRECPQILHVCNHCNVAENSMHTISIWGKMPCDLNHLMWCQCECECGVYLNVCEYDVHAASGNAKPEPGVTWPALFTWCGTILYMFLYRYMIGFMRIGGCRPEL